MFCFLDLPFALHCGNANCPRSQNGRPTTQTEYDKETETDPALGAYEFQLKKLSLRATRVATSPDSEA